MRRWETGSVFSAFFRSANRNKAQNQQMQAESVGAKRVHIDRRVVWENWIIQQDYWAENAVRYYAKKKSVRHA